MKGWRQCWQGMAAVTLLALLMGCSEDASGMRGAAIPPAEAATEPAAEEQVLDNVETASMDASSTGDEAAADEAEWGAAPDAASVAMAAACVPKPLGIWSGSAVPPSIVGLWRFNEQLIATTSAPTAADTHDAMAVTHYDALYPAVPKRPAVVAGQVLTGLRFDGVDDHLEVPNPSDNGLSIAAAGTGGGGGNAIYTGDLTILAWVKPSPGNLGKFVRAIVDKRGPPPGSTSGLRGYHLFLYGRQLGLQLADSTGYTNYLTAANVIVPDDGKYHLIGVQARRLKSSPTVRWFLDGKQVGIQPIQRLGDLNTSRPLRIGVTNDGTSPFKGDLDELAIFNRVIQLYEHGQIYTAGLSGMGLCP